MVGGKGRAEHSLCRGSDTGHPSCSDENTPEFRIMCSIESLQEKYSALEIENKRNKAIINQLELKVRQFEEKDSLKSDKHPEKRYGL